MLQRNWEKKKKEGKIWERRSMWGNVGGSVEKGETPKQAVIREAGEEIGLKLNQKAVIAAFTRDHRSAEKPYTVHFYATSIEESTKIKLNDESCSYKWFSTKKLPSNMLDKKEDVIKCMHIAIAKIGKSSASR
ncbi:NUDIX hydrolase [Candidatus Marsarchaeota archaeon]|nr:NUDIX hydrolase [Candidatus Marsarchaeota archaeon]